MAEQFIEELQTYTEDPAVFRKFLLPSTLADNLLKTNRYIYRHIDAVLEKLTSCL